MKKITLLLTLFLYSLFGYSQTETFDSGIPSDWLVTNGANGIGNGIQWSLNTATYPAYQGTGAAFINNEFIGQGNTEEDWLITNQKLVPTNGQFRFFTRQTTVGNQSTLYELRVSNQPGQGVLTNYTVLQSWTELTLTNQALPVTTYEEKAVTLPASYVGQNVYFAFVRIYTQTGTARAGDRWLVDNVRLVEKCLDPVAPNVLPANIAATTALLQWNNPGGATTFEVINVPTGSDPSLGVTETVTVPAGSNPATYLKTGLTPQTTYDFYVRAICGTGPEGIQSALVGPFTYTTLLMGAKCTDPIAVTTLPYQAVGQNTANFGDHYDIAQATLCGATPAGTNYLAGDDVFYSYTATQSGTISITMTPLGAAATNSSVFVYNTCPAANTPCVAGLANSTSNVRVVTVSVVAGQSYVIVISSSAATQSIPYELLIQREDCVPKPTALTAANITTVSADLSWVSAGYSSWQVAVQPLGTTVPTTAGVPVTGTPAYTATLVAATQYQYWVRAECTPGSGIFTAWAGPYPFNSLVCEPVDKCTYIFRMTDSANNGWNNARMDIRQNGIVIATIGSTYNSGAGPVDIPVALCKNVPFDVLWTVAGTQPQQCILTVINSFGQKIFIKAAGAGTVGSSVYNGVVNCDTPQCDIAPEAVTITNITTTGGTINWVAPATTSWDIYVYPQGSPAPTADTVPTYNDVTTNGFATTIALIPDNTYNVCVRVNCEPFPSAWTCASFTTLATCPKPIVTPATAVPVATITQTEAVVNWSPGSASDANWEILLIPGPDVPAAPPVDPVLTGGTLSYIVNIPTPAASYSYTATGLQVGTVYYYYVRTLCAGNDKSTWTGPVKFNTITCAEADKCIYKFILTDTANNGWNGARLQVRQNGIVLPTTIGQQITGGGPTVVNIAICPNLPFDVYWNVEGTAPSEIGFTIQNPFTDIIFTKLPGVGAVGQVLYSNTSLGNCTPPTCPKPTNLLVTSTSQTGGVLSWTEAGSATSWEVFIVPVTANTPVPVNGTPLNTGIPNYYIATDNTNFVIPVALLSGTQYIYYVRAICSATDISTWTILSPKTFITKPINDECSASISLPVNPTQVCAQSVSASTLGATGSLPLTAPACPGNTGDDIWFSFVATNNIHIININNVVGTTTDVNHALYLGTDCGTLQQIYCSNPNNSVATGLVIGSTYKIRVYTNGTNKAQSATFDICIGTPPPPATNDACEDAINITVNVNAKCTYTTAGNVIGATPSPQPSTCVGSEDDDVWFTFTATSQIHYITLSNVAGTTTDLNHAVYTGTCGAMTLKYCSTAGSLTSNASNFVVGQTYYVRVWSNSAASQVATFDICVKSVSTCENAEPFCGSSPTNPYIYENTTGVTSTGEIACLGSIPNPTYYTLHVGETGTLAFNILQNTQFDALGNPVGNNLDVDFVAWGPFDTVESCNQIAFSDCPTCPNNTSNANFYPFGNIVDCSYDASFTETLTIPNAIAGQYYIILVTNFNGQAGFIRLVQTNFGAPAAGTTVCCDVDLGPDKTVCATSVELDALEGLADLENVPSDFQWFLNSSTTPIAGANAQTYLADVSGTYTVKAMCGVNAVSDEIIVTLGPIIATTTPADYIVCDDISNDGIGQFDLPILTPQVLGTLDPTSYIVTYHLTEDDAEQGNFAIDTTTLFTNTTPFLQIIYIRVQSTSVTQCFAVVPVNLRVETFVDATFTYESAQYCKSDVNPLPVVIGVGGVFTSTPDGLVIDPTTGEIDLTASVAGDYIVTNNAGVIGGIGCGNTTVTFTVTIVEPLLADFNYGDGTFCTEAGTTAPQFGPNAGAGTFTATPAGLVIDAATGVVDLGSSAAGVYTVTNNIAAAGTCAADVKSTQITITNARTGTISYNSPFCKSSTSEVVTNTAQAGGQYTAEAGLSIDAVTGVVNPSLSTPGVYNVKYTIAASGGCDEFIAETPVTVIIESIVDFASGCDANDYVLTALPLSESFDPATATYAWTGPNFIAGETPNSIILKTPGEYTVTITTIDGCQSVEPFSILDISCDIQKGISPNNDGKNDSFDLTNLNVRHISIFNRYGTEVYQFDNYTNQWFGQSNKGEHLPDGTYFYVIDKADGKSKTGWIYINR